jgi:hypothetical protein
VGVGVCVAADKAEVGGGVNWMCDVIVVRFTLFTRRPINGSGKTSYRLKIGCVQSTIWPFPFSLGWIFFANSYSVIRVSYPDALNPDLDILKNPDSDPCCC